MLLPAYPDLPQHTTTVELDGAVYRLTYTWRERTASWYVDVADGEGVALLSGARLSPGVSIFAGIVVEGAPDGALHVRGIDGYAEADLGTNNVRLSYLTPERLLETPEAVADAADAADTPLTSAGYSTPFSGTVGQILEQIAPNAAAIWSTDDGIVLADDGTVAEWQDNYGFGYDLFAVGAGLLWDSAAFGGRGAVVTQSTGGLATMFTLGFLDVTVIAVAAVYADPGVDVSILGQNVNGANVEVLSGAAQFYGAVRDATGQTVDLSSNAPPHAVSLIRTGSAHLLNLNENEDSAAATRGDTFSDFVALNVGQDASGSNRGDGVYIALVAIWSRALSYPEQRAIHQALAVLYPSLRLVTT